MPWLQVNQDNGSVLSELTLVATRYFNKTSVVAEMAAQSCIVVLNNDLPLCIPSGKCNLNS